MADAPEPPVLPVAAWRRARLRQPAGVLELLSAAELAKADAFGHADPFAIVRVNGLQVAQSAVTRVAGGSKDPDFGHQLLDLHGLVAGRNSAQLELCAHPPAPCSLCPNPQKKGNYWAQHAMLTAIAGQCNKLGAPQFLGQVDLVLSPPFPSGGVSLTRQLRPAAVGRYCPLAPPPSRCRCPRHCGLVVDRACWVSAERAPLEDALVTGTVSFRIRIRESQDDCSRTFRVVGAAAAAGGAEEERLELQVGPLGVQLWPATASAGAAGGGDATGLAAGTTPEGDSGEELRRPVARFLFEEIRRALPIGAGGSGLPPGVLLQRRPQPGNGVPTSPRCGPTLQTRAPHQCNWRVQMLC